jgi:hypothetical protein
MPAPTPESTSWCFDLPLVDRRALSADECAALQREAVQQRLLGWVCGSLFVVVLLIGIGVAAVVVSDHPDTPLQWPLWVGIAAPVLPLLICRQALRRARCARLDVRAGEVCQFAGGFTNGVVQSIQLQPEVNPLRPGERIVLDILAGSGRLWRVNGQATRQFLECHIISTVNQPAIAGIAAQWLEPVGEVDGQQIDGGRRELSDAECVELRRIALNLWRRPLVPASILSLWCFPLLGYSLWIGRVPPEWGQYFFLITMTAYADIIFLRNWFLARRIDRDIDNGSVLIWQKYPAPESTDPPQTVEHLPNSNLPWTIDGKPAGWRKG